MRIETSSYILLNYFMKYINIQSACNIFLS